MKIEGKIHSNVLYVRIDGRIDMDTAHELEAFLSENAPGKDAVEIDLKKTEYISSAGLRVFLKLKKLTDKEDFVILRHMNETVRSVFELTGFSDMFIIK